jgi:hypothetical protein
MRIRKRRGREQVPDDLVLDNTFLRVSAYSKVVPEGLPKRLKGIFSPFGVTDPAQERASLSGTVAVQGNRT